jgi:hypothetical protein
MARREAPIRENPKYPQQPLVVGWSRLIRRAMKFKKTEFQDDADDCMRFFNGTKSDLWQGAYAKSSRGFIAEDSQGGWVPEFQMVLMRVAEMVQLFGPALYATNPQANIVPEYDVPVPPEALGIDPAAAEQGDFAMQAAMQEYQALVGEKNKRDLRASTAGKVLQKILNYYQRELNKEYHSRRIIDEAVITGLGVGWIEAYSFPGDERRMIGTFYETNRRLVWDPDAEDESEILWMARQRVQPVWEAAARFGIDKHKDVYEEFRKACQLDSVESQEMVKEGPETDYEKKKGESNDLLVYWDVYSKMGMGDRMKGIDPKWRERYKKFGNYCYIANCNRVPYPLNLHPGVNLKDDDELMVRSHWPIPFYEDGGWPCRMLAFSRVPGHTWPMSRVKPGLGELKWLTWAYSFLADKVKESCGTVLACMKEAGADLKQALSGGPGRKLIELERILGTKINDIVSFLQEPRFQGDIWNVVAAVSDQLDRALGTSEILYGTAQRQDRSATETRVKNENAGARVSDMATQVETFLSDVNRGECIALQYLLETEEIAPIVGPLGAKFYDQYIANLKTKDVAREFKYEIVGGSTRRKSKAAQLDDMMMFLQNMGTPAQQLAVNGAPQSWNAMVEDVGDAMGWAPERTQRYLIPPPPPPEEQPPDPKVQSAQMKAEADMQKAQMDMQAKQQDMEIKRQQAEMDTNAKMIELQAKQQELAMQLQAEREKIAMLREKHEMDMQADAAKAQLDAQIEREKAAQDMEVEQTRAASQLRTEQVRAASAIQISEQQAESQAKLGEQQSQAKIEQTKQMGKVQAQNAQAKAAAAPKKNASNKKK